MRTKLEAYEVEGTGGGNTARVRYFKESGYQLMLTDGNFGHEDITDTCYEIGLYHKADDYVEPVAFIWRDDATDTTTYAGADDSNLSFDEALAEVMAHI